MFLSEFIKRLEEIPGDGEVTDVNGAELVDVTDDSYRDDDSGEYRDRVVLRFEGE
jgi:hypothetical protein